MNFAPSLSAAPKVIPSGLRSFDAGDADFFLSLLLGPGGRDGLPESVRFWRTRIEQTDPEETFPVGLIYGPSGCGKSSLVKAGLAPLLGEHVLPIYVEATGDRTVAQLLAALTKRCPSLSQSDGLRGALASLRRGQALPAGKKVLIVLDQFEQWLHARRETTDGDLVEAVRRKTAAVPGAGPRRFLDGGHPVPGRAEGPAGRGDQLRLPDLPAIPARAQRHFLEQAVAGWAQ
jgi:hypothetical protein